MNVATAYTSPPLQPRLLQAIIDRNLRLCYTSNSGIVDSGHLTALTGIYLGVACRYGAQEGGQNATTMNNKQAYADLGMSHDWLSVHPFAEASEVRNSAW